MIRFVSISALVIISYVADVSGFIAPFTNEIFEDFNQTGKNAERTWGQQQNWQQGYQQNWQQNSRPSWQQNLQNSNSWQTLQNPFKFFSNPFYPLFMIHLKPNPCKTASGREGFCASRKDCAYKGGKSDGYCARGIGVCCLNEHRCGSIIQTNNSLLVNEDYPSATDDIGNCQYIIDKMHPNICQFRLDFDEFTLVGPNRDTSLCDQDTFTVVGTAGDNPQVLCGENSGQHMYIELAAGYGSARINIATASSGIRRDWKIRVTQIECNSMYRAPPNCLQHFTAYSNVINSFNYQTMNGSHMIGGMSYTICVKTREGYCGITYQSANFSVSGNADTQARPIIGDIECDTDFISIFTQDKTGVVGNDRFCGTALNTTTTFSKPFEIRVITDSIEPRGEDVNNKGFSIRYTQVPC